MCLYEGLDGGGGGVWYSLFIKLHPDPLVCDCGSANALLFQNKYQ